MLFPEQLYELTARDQQTRWLVFNRGYGTLSQASTSIRGPQIAYQVPVDKIFLCYTAHAEFIAGGGGQQVTIGAIEINEDVFGFGLYQSVERTRNDTGLTRFFQQSNQKPFIVPGGSFLAAYGGFSAGAGANTVNFSWSGILIPKGNVVL